jgi:hypothetical protein
VDHVNIPVLGNGWKDFFRRPGGKEKDYLHRIEPCFSPIHIGLVQAVSPSIWTTRR